MLHVILTRFAAQACDLQAQGNTNMFFGLPKWYKYLPGIQDPQSNTCIPHVVNIQNVWLILAAVLEMMLRFAVVVAIIMVIWGGIQYIISQGLPDRTQAARQTVLNAVIGMVISLSAATIISFVAGRFN